MPNILVTPRSITRSGHPSLDRLRSAGFELRMPTPGEQPDESVLLKELPGCVGYLAGIEPITARVLSAAAGLKVISRNGTGIDNIDMSAAERCGIRVLRAEGVMARGVAELTIGLILGLARSIPQSDSQLKRRDWSRSLGMEIEKKALGIIGCGRIGKLVAHLATGLGMRVLGHDHAAGAVGPSKSIAYVSFEELLFEADIITLHCPAKPNGIPLIDTKAIAQMKRGVLLVNTARGELLDDKAVLAALDNGHLGGLAIDSYRHEPPGDDPLVMHERVIATPHIGAYTRESIDRTMELTVDNLLSALG